jgi:hypothetical protein
LAENQNWKTIFGACLSNQILRNSVQQFRPDIQRERHDFHIRNSISLCKEYLKTANQTQITNATLFEMIFS